MNKPQAIAGVSPQRERTVAITYPSMSSGPLGRCFGWLYESIPIRLGTVKLSHLLFCLPLAPITVLIYLGQKFLGQTYEITNRSVNIWTMALGTRSRRAGTVDLSAIDEIAVQQLSGQEFFDAADLYLLAADGSTLLKLPGVCNPAVFRQTILKSRDARRQTDAALSVIEARKTA